MNNKMKYLKFGIYILIYLVLTIPFIIIGEYYNFLNLFNFILYIGWLYMINDISNKFSNWLFKELNGDENVCKRM